MSVAPVSGVRGWLASLGLAGRYWAAFSAHGYDREDDVPHLTARDLAGLGVTEPAHVSTILAAASEFQPSTEFQLLRWLEDHGLGHYHDNLLRTGEYVSVAALAQAPLGEALYAELEMDVPGHRRRLERAVHSLHKSRKLEEPEVPVAMGYWGKPACLADARNDFLCLQATLESTLTSRTQTIEFMVDSGSDVVTVQEGVMAGLGGLEPVGSVHSVGIHSAARRKQMYTARLWVGGVPLTVEVISESFASVGNQVLQHFRHYIDPRRHFWLGLNSAPATSTASASKKDSSQRSLALENEQPCLPRNVDLPDRHVESSDHHIDQTDHLPCVANYKGSDGNNTGDQIDIETHASVKSKGSKRKECSKCAPCGECSMEEGTNCVQKQELDIAARGDTSAEDPVTSMTMGEKDHLRTLEDIKDNPGVQSLVEAKELCDITNINA